MSKKTLTKMLCTVAALASLILCSCAWPTADGGGDSPEWVQAAEGLRDVLEPQLELWESVSVEGDVETVAAVRLSLDGLFNLATAAPSLRELEGLLPAIDALLVSQGDGEEERARKLAAIRSGIALLWVGLESDRSSPSG